MAHILAGAGLEQLAAEELLVADVFQAERPAARPACHDHLQVLLCNSRSLEVVVPKSELVEGARDIGLEGDAARIGARMPYLVSVGRGLKKADGT